MPRVRACQHHPEEAALGICIVCSAPLCDACITKVDGINHCRTCLLALAAGLTRATPRAPGKLDAAFGWLSFAAGLLLLAALALQTLNAVLPEGSP
jgi:hypothetical protein